MFKLYLENDTYEVEQQDINSNDTIAESLC